MSKVVAIRPEPGLSATLARGRGAGLDIVGWPLFEIRAVEWEPPLAEGIDGLLIGSANALHLGGPALAGFKDKPVYAVGRATAEGARQAGFTVGAVGRGGLQEMLDALPRQPRTLLRLAGREHVPLDPPLGTLIVQRVVYESVALPMPDDMAGELADGALVLLHSAAAAAHFARECDRLGIARSGLALAALGPRIAAAAGEGWREVRSAQEPGETPILALARDMCH